MVEIAIEFSKITEFIEFLSQPQPIDSKRSSDCSTFD